MKMAVIIGVFHMMKGICVKGFNAVFFRNWIVFIFEVVTGLIILGGLFGWMDVLIYGKWFNDYKAYNFLIPHGSDASAADIANYET
jgi:V-type H+-transporting ATPase subunit a